MATLAASSGVMSTLASPDTPVAAEQAAGAAALPDDRGVDDGAVLDRLERVHLHVVAEHGVVADEHLVAEHHALVAADVGAEVAGPADDRAPQPGAGPDVDVVVDARCARGRRRPSTRTLEPSTTYSPSRQSGLDLAAGADDRRPERRGRRARPRRPRRATRRRRSGSRGCRAAPAGRARPCGRSGRPRGCPRPPSSPRRWRRRAACRRRARAGRPRSRSRPTGRRRCSRRPPGSST